MWVYGDCDRLAAPDAVVVGLRAMLARLPPGPGLARHQALVAALIGAGELAQGLADAHFATAGEDGPDPAADAAMALLHRLAHAIRASWHGQPDGIDPGFDFPGGLPDQIRLRQAEGFAHYALYPEAYLLAAERLGRRPDAMVIGLRSIGAPLAAMVAAGLGAGVPVTLRPVGDPYRRGLRISAALRRRLLQARRFCIVDEGPGRSGSSLGAVADWLEAEGVAPESIDFFPGHDGDLGPEASAAHVARWAGARRHVVGFDALMHLPSGASRLATWFADLTGPAEAAPQDVSGGAWREPCADAQAPPSFGWQERRKYRLRADGRDWLLKFTGLGAGGARRAEMAARLAAAGLTPEVRGYRHGFLLQAWETEAVRLDAAALPASLPGWLAAYLGFRARSFPGGTGADLATLWRMACHNTALALGDAAGRALAATGPDIAALERGVRRVAIDGRLQSWEFLQTPDGRLLKTDAVDHHAGHDLVGCQDIAWDVAAAAVELEMDDAALRLALAAQGVRVDAALTAFYLPCYLAFQLGLHAMAGGGAAEAAGHRARSQALAARLRIRLAAPLRLAG